MARTRASKYRYVYHIPKADYTKHPIQLFAEYEAEIADYGLALPAPWPWAIDSEGVVDMAMRLQQLSELVHRLRKEHPNVKTDAV